MRWLIRRVTKRAKGAVAYEEDIHYGDVLTIGRGSDQAIFIPDLRVALEHARITAMGSGQYKVESLILAGIRVNNELTHATTVAAGASIEIGSNRLQLLEAPVDFDAGVEVSTLDKTEEKAKKAAKALPTSLDQTWLSRRIPSWALFLLIAAFGLLVPLAAHFVPQLSEKLPSLPIPSQISWQAGELDAAHHFFGSDCKQCHEKAFRWVRDEACGVCHGATTKAHADPAKFNLPELADARCAHCHRDHNGARGLIVNDQILCSDCHADLKARTQNASTLADVSDFLTAHPPFMVDLPAWDANGKFVPVRTPLATPGIKENSGLIFPHDIHLDAKGIQSPNGLKVLQCDSCHVPDASGAAMKQVDFEPMCQDCHRLTFDVLEPERQVPHAKVAEIIYTLDEFYARRALEGGYNDTTAPTVVQVRRRPGEILGRQQELEVLAWARDKARRTGDSLFTGKACSVCHSVTRGSGDEPWKIAPVRVAGIWYGKARFTHARHTTMECEDCHDAQSSKASTDLLIPDIANCRQCHGGESARDLVPTTCIQCHGYHDHDQLVLAELQARAKSAPAAAGSQ
jgi:hypothetical protein